MAIRKNQAWLSDPDKLKFVSAVVALKAEKKPGNTLSTYDQYVQWHKDTVQTDPVTGRVLREDAHAGPAFFAWHRVFLLEFEKDLQRKSGDPNLGLPYWDWRIDNSPTSSIWANNFMGGNGKESDWAVMDGPFRRDQWVLSVRGDDPYSPEKEEPTYLRRKFGSDPHANSLPTGDDVKAALDATPFDVAPWDDNSESGFRNRAEGYIPQPEPKPPPEQRIPQMHNRVHRWVGGSMIPITSPNDPVFFLHHCFMDKLWSDWQVLELQRGGPIDHSLYLPEHGARPGHNLDDIMSRWNTSPAHVIFNHGQLGYRYDSDQDMQPFDELRPGEQIWSANAQYYLTYESSGNLVLYHYTPHAKEWESGTAGRPVGVCRMEGYGNLAIYGPGGKPPPIWQSNTDHNAAGSRLVVRNDGKVAIYQPDGRQLWSRPPPTTG
jgi:tyrosinase